MALTHQFLIVPWEQIESLSQLNKSLFPDSKFRYKNNDMQDLQANQSITTGLNAQLTEHQYQTANIILAKSLVY